MNIKQIQYALQLYQTGSFNKAAKTLYQSQPNLSNTIRSLEEELDYQIFIRTAQGVTPTEKGLRFLGIANAMMEQYEALLKVSQEETPICSFVKHIWAVSA